MTIKEIAKLASVSTGTVDRVIHNRGYVNAEKRAVVEKIIRDSGFKPNIYARNLKLNQNTRIAFITPLLDTENGYWRLVNMGVQRALKDLQDTSFSIDTYEYDRRNTKTFIDVADRMLETNPGGCLLIPKCPDIARKLVSENENLPFVLLDTMLPGLHPLCTISQNFYRGGYLAGLLLSLLQPNAKHIMTFNFMESIASKERIRGFKEYFKTRTIDNLSINDPEELGDVLLEYLKENDDVDAIFSPCSMGFMVGNIVTNVGKKDQIKILSYDLIKENRQALLHGTIDCVISQRPVYQGYAGVYQLYRYLVQKQEIEQELDIQMDILFQENLPEDFNQNRKGVLNSYCIPSTLY